MVLEQGRSATAVAAIGRLRADDHYGAVHTKAPGDRLHCPRTGESVTHSETLHHPGSTSMETDLIIATTSLPTTRPSWSTASIVTRASKPA